MKTTFLFVFLCCLLSAPRFAHAGEYRYDFDLAKLHNAYDNTDPFVALSDRTVAYRNLVSEMGVAFGPSFLAPAETLGYMGMAMGVNYGITTVNGTADYWKNGVDGTAAGFLQTIGMEVRRGMWFPLPGFEIGGGLKYLTESHMYAPHVMAKFSINEGYFDIPLPAIAVRGFGSRVMGSREVDLTIASVDVSLSTSFGVASTINLTPYLGYNYLMIIGDSKVIDTTPGTDSLNPDGNTNFGPGLSCTDADCNNNVVFDDQDTIARHRIFFGTRIMYHKMTITLEGIFTLKGSSKDQVLDPISGRTQDLKDKSVLQQTYSIQFGWDF
jgi:hypothetical protein